MNFGQLLKDARKQSEKTLKEVSQVAGVSLSYVSDIEQGRRKAPSVEIVRRIETFLGITDNTLVRAAQSEMDLSTEARNIFRRRPELNMQLLRASDYFSEEELTKMINKMLEDKGTKNDRS